MADKKVAEQYYSPPPKLGKWEGFKIFMWNSETSQFMGRTGSSWGKFVSKKKVVQFFFFCSHLNNYLGAKILKLPLK